ncbi:MAG TPA: response regulator transcription factor [Gammaproteobacteria bacterium]|nr:response regulator transcription factor [Gammaproteobacteria bacterium]
MQKFKDKTTVLVVDDSPDSLGMINMALDKAEIAVLIALNGQQALNVLEQITPDVILLDAIMPVMDGYECAREIRKQLPLVPIIFMTGLSDVSDIVKAFDAGGNDYIVKPIRPEELLVRIRQHTNSARMLMEAQKALDSMRQHVFCINKNGKILWATPEAQALLNQYQQEGEKMITLSEQLYRWLPNGQAGHNLALPIQQQDLILTVHYFKQTEEDEFLLKLQSPNVEIHPSVLEESLAITYREAEVLLWLAHGKTNREVAEILKMSPRTVNKHLEQMYPKIGANNRTAAAAIAIQTILGGHIGQPPG